MTFTNKESKMNQDPERLSSLLASLRETTGEAATFMILRDGIPRATVIGIDRAGAIAFHSCEDSFTRSIAKAYDHGKKVTKADFAEVDHPSPTAADELIGQIAALRSYLGTNVPAMAETILDEMTTTSRLLQAAFATSGRFVPAANMVQVAAMMAVGDILPQIEAKVADARSKLDDADPASAGNFLEGAQIAIKRLNDAIYGADLPD